MDKAVGIWHRIKKFSRERFAIWKTALFHDTLTGESRKGCHKHLLMYLTSGFYK